MSGGSDIRDEHEDVLLSNFSISKYNGCLMKVFPDDYGTDLVQFCQEEDRIILRLIQVKLGDSYLSPGKVGQKSKVPPDTIHHMIMRFRVGEDKMRDTFSHVENLHIEQVAYITRKLSHESCSLLRVHPFLILLVLNLGL